jgi:5-methylcytosine-specific restriction endonuclease McrA
VRKLCSYHGIVDPQHQCFTDPATGQRVIGTQNQRRAAKNRVNHTKSTYWSRVRRQRLALDGHRCTFRFPDICTGQATMVHLDPALNGNHLAATLDNTRSACRRCHGRVDGKRTPPH